jgi:hypothetical protein
MFKQVGRSKVMLMRKNSAGGGTTFKCECSLAGGCKVTIDPQDPQTISCLESGCSGDCGWIISIPGLVGLKFRAVKV